MNKTALQQLLRERGLYARKEHGQNFLIDGNVMRFVVDSAGLDPKRVVLEVGTGLGQLTLLLCAQAGQVVSVEIDPRLLVLARERLVDCHNLELIGDDCLEKKSRLAGTVTTALERAGAGAFDLVANLPYNCASPLLLALLELDLERADAQAMRLSQAVVMVQLDVCHRWTAGPGSKAYGVPSILMQLLARVELLKCVKPACFWPQPQVTSAIARLTRLPAEEAAPAEIYRAVKALVRSLFCYRRKTLSKACKNARDLPWQRPQLLAAFDAQGVAASQRVETLPPTVFRAVAQQLAGDGA